MVYEDESSDDFSSLQITNSSDDGMQYQIPASIEDPDYMGIETGLMVPCEHHRMPAERRVAFEGFDTGRRFLVCARQEDQNCGFVEWIDPEWPPTMQNALLKLWQMYEDSKSDRRNDNLESSLTIHHLTEEKNKLEANYDKLVVDVHQLFNAQEDRMLDFSYLQYKMQSAEERRAEVTKSAVSDIKTEMEKKEAEIFKLQEKYAVLMNLTKAQGTVIQNLKMDHLKEKEKLTKDRDQVKLHISELLKAEEKNKQKMKGIQAILDE